MDLSKFEDGLMFSPLQIQLMNTLEKEGPLTRKDLMNKLNSPRTTIYDNLTRLQNHNIIRKFSRPTNSRGIPLVFFKLVDED